MTCVDIRPYVGRQPLRLASPLLVACAHHVHSAYLAYPMTMVDVFMYMYIHHMIMIETIQDIIFSSTNCKTGYFSKKIELLHVEFKPTTLCVLG